MLLQRITIQQNGYIVARAKVPANITLGVYLSNKRRPTSKIYELYSPIEGKSNGYSDYVMLRVTATSRVAYIGIALESDDRSEKDKFDFELEIFATGCLFFDKSQKRWSDSGCRVGIIYIFRLYLENLTLRMRMSYASYETFKKIK